MNPTAFRSISGIIRVINKVENQRIRRNNQFLLSEFYIKSNFVRTKYCIT